MTADDLTRLRAVAEAATPGPWTENVLGSEGYDVRAENPNGSIRRLTIARCGREDWDTDKANAEFIAAFDPPTVAALIDRVERAERGYDGATAAVAGALFQRDKARAELSALRAAVEGLADEWERYANLRYTESGQVIVYGATAERLRAMLTEGSDDGQ